jgi:hypothetical protein
MQFVLLSLIDPPLALCLEKSERGCYLILLIVPVSHCPRTSNSVAHTIAALGLSCVNGPVYWQDQLPECVALVVSSELPGQRF